MATTISNATLTVTVTEAVTLNGSPQGSTNSFTISSVDEVYKRILTCPANVDTTILRTGVSADVTDSSLDIADCKYIRVTNLSTTEDMKLALVTSATNYQVTVRAGGSHILFQAENGAIGETDTSPAFGTLEDIASVQVRPSGSADVQVEIFVGLV